VSGKRAYLPLVAAIFLAIYLLITSIHQEYVPISSVGGFNNSIGFGYSVSLSDKVVVVGDPFASSNDKDISGRAYVLSLSGEVITTLHPPRPVEGAGFGECTAVKGDIVAVGEPGASYGDKNSSGRAYLFDLNENLIAVLQDPEPMEDAGFGESVALSGEMVVVGEPFANVSGKEWAGRAFFFKLNRDVMDIIQSPVPVEGGGFSESVAVSDDFVVVGEPGASYGDINSAGRAYIFSSDGDLITALQASEPSEGAGFGESVAAFGDVVVVGEPYASTEDKICVGKAHIYNSDGGLIDVLMAPEPVEATGFGKSVAVSGDIIVVGEPFAPAKGEYAMGRVHVFEYPKKPITTLQTKKRYVYFGHSVSVDGSKIVVGEISVDAGETNTSGTALIFDLSKMKTVFRFTFDDLQNDSILITAVCILVAFSLYLTFERNRES
jgi:hypothetical protein